jgi:OFA family oxalate/formate antiporter-like MFS transporter
MNRWIIVVAAVMVQFALGAIYSYAFINPNVLKFIDPITPPANYSPDLKTQALLPFAFGLLFFSIAMIPAGRWQDKAGPKIVAITGTIILTVGILLAGVVAMFPSGGSVWGLVVTFGMIGGAGIGFAYVCPIACATKWFPDKVGLINGLAVAGFGAGSILFNFLYDGIPRIATFSLALITCGVIMGGLGLSGAFILRNPPAGYKPAGWEPPAPKPGAAPPVESWTTKEMVKTKTFYLLWGMYMMSAICGLMVIGNFVTYGKTFLGASTVTAVAVYIAALAGVCNAVGRIFWGKLSDKIGRVRTMSILFLVQAAAMMLFAVQSVATWAIFGNLVYFCFGGNLALFPATTRSYYGAKYMGLNYGVVFSAYGTAGILGALLASPLLTAMNNNYSGYFIIFGCMSIASLVLSFITKAPERKA